MKILIRRAIISDLSELKELYQDTVLTVNREDYTKEEVKDWASCGNDIEHWSELLKEHHYIVAENENGMIVGFASVNDYGYMNAVCSQKLPG